MIRGDQKHHILYQDTQLLGLSSPISSHRPSSFSRSSVRLSFSGYIIHQTRIYHIYHQDTQLLRLSSLMSSHRLSSFSRLSVRPSQDGVRYNIVDDATIAVNGHPADDMTKTTINILKMAIKGNYLSYTFGIATKPDVSALQNVSQNVFMLLKN